MTWQSTKDLRCSVVKNHLLMQEAWVWSWVGKIPWRRKWQPTPAFLPGKSRGQRSLVGSQWGCQESDTTDQLSTHAKILFQFSSVAQSRLTLCDPMDYGRPNFPVCHQVPELAQTHVHWVDNAIQPSYPLLSLLFLTSIFPSIRVFSSKSVLRIRWPKYWSFSISISPSNEYSQLISLRMDWFDLAVQGTLKSSPTP